MKPTVTKTMLVPRYVAHFRCIGPECPSTCCAGWRVSVDKATYQQYKNSTDPVVAPIFKTILQRNRQASRSGDYGRLKLDIQGGCALQDKNGLCQVQQRLGETALSDTCHNYPRVTRQFAGQHEQVLTLSCPEAARLALSSEDAFAFEAVPMSARAHLISKHKVAGLSDEAQFATRAWVLQLLHTEALAISDRLAILGLLCDQLEPLVAGKQSEKILALLPQMTALVESGSLTETLAALPCDEALQVQLFALFLCKGVPSAGMPVVNAIFADVVQGLGADQHQQVEMEALLQCYREGRRLLDATPDFNGILSRYFLNEAIREVFPWQAGSPLQQHRRWVTLYGVLRVMLAGYACQRGRTLHAQEVVDVIWAFCRAFQHNMTFTASVEEVLKRCQWDSLPQLLAVIK